MRQSMAKPIVLGLMSGTSLDGVDAVAVDFSCGSPFFLGHSYLPYSQPLKETLLSLCTSGFNEIERMQDTAVVLAHRYAEAINTLTDQFALDKSRILAAGVHGQTIRHRPEKGWSTQLNNPALIAELAEIDVVADFRSRDLAAGGEGAPLVPAFHREIFSGPTPRAIVNIGGIANVTVLDKRDGGSPLLGFDCGPGNILMDAWCRLHIGQDFDRDGKWAASGKVDRALLARLLSEPYFKKMPPKSTGRELFHLQWLEQHLGNEAPANVQRTLVALTAYSIADAVRRAAPRPLEIFLCGGGALNPVLVSEIQSFTPNTAVRSTQELGVHPMYVESMAFAWLAYRFFQRKSGNLPSVTRARGLRVLGALYPH